MSDWKQIIAGIAPTLATALGGPYAGMATKYIAHELLGDESAPDSDIETAILGANADQLANIKQIDYAFKIKTEELKIDLAKASLDNTKDARLMAKETTLIPQAALTFLFVVGYFTLLFILILTDIKMNDATETVMTLLLGALSTGIPQILKFWFGGSPHDNSQYERIYKSTPKD